MVNRFGLSLLFMLGLLTVCIGAYLTLNQQASWSFTLQFRGKKVLLFVLVGASVAIATVLFQTITHNRILTPAIMGFDTLYILLQTTVLWLLGSQQYSQLDSALMWLIEVCLLSGFMFVLFRWLFGKQRQDLHTLVLIGVVFGVLFRSLTLFMTRMIDPSEFVVLQDAMFASFNQVPVNIMGLSAIFLCVASAIAWKDRHKLDVLLLGKDHAINLGIEYQKLVLKHLVIIAVLVSISTALVGPITFFGLMVANLAYHLSGTYKHSVTLVTASLLGCICLLGGEVLLQHVFQFNTRLSFIIEFVGGIFFLILLVRQGRYART
ncbi:MULTISPECIES: iron chelate uptake ABC transporter family permease subunit [unclassified Vibrio]|uniref:iron chelate uptake ABC transporter family permease subunit n=1 Tax=unclassified Vibrio TaxID=2614977 RepID=UPI0018D3CB5A|nr:MULTISPECIES: iron chelate uptake ABC transporter family permease subunit [unclassified Vibrio]